MSDQGTQGTSGTQTADGTSTAAQGTQGGTQGGSQAQTFTQEQLEQIVTQRLSRERAKFSDYDEVKARAAKADELEQAQQTETDKLRAKAERAEQKRAESEDKATKASERADKALKRAAVVAAAAQGNAADPHDVYTLLMATSAAQTLTVDDDGNVAGAAEAVNEFLKAKPNLLKRAGGFDGGQHGASTTQIPDMNTAIRAAAGIGGR